MNACKCKGDLPPMEHRVGLKSKLRSQAYKQLFISKLTEDLKGPITG